MSEKRFRVNDLVKYDYSEIGEYIDENHTDRPLRNDEVCDLLNEQQAIIDEQKIAINEMITDYKNLEKENEQLKQKIQRWKNLYELKDSEVTARVDALNKVCNYYLTEAQFKAETDPNEAVKEVIHEILNTEVKNDE